MPPPWACWSRSTTAETVADQRRAEPQLHHQRDAARAAPGQADLQAPRPARTWMPSSKAAAGTCRRALVVTDGIFSMRGDHAPLPEILEIVERYDKEFPENAVVVVDDSHGVGAFGHTGRGTEEYTGSRPVDILIGTLGKALGVNGGYVTGSRRARRVPAGDGAALHLLEPDHPGRGRRRDAGRWRSSTAPEGLRAAGAPARDDGALREGDRGARLRDHPRRAPRGAAHGAGHAEDQRAGPAPARRTASWRPASSTRSCRAATRRSASRSPPTTRRSTSTPP